MCYDFTGFFCNLRLQKTEPNGFPSADDIFKDILNESYFYLDLAKFVRNGQIANKSLLVKLMTCRRTCERFTYIRDIIWHQYAIIRWKIRQTVKGQLHFNTPPNIYHTYRHTRGDGVNELLATFQQYCSQGTKSLSVKFRRSEDACKKLFCMLLTLSLCFPWILCIVIL